MAVNENLPLPPIPPALPKDLLPAVSNLKTHVFKKGSNTEEEEEEEDLNCALQRLLSSNTNPLTLLCLSNTNLKPQIQDGPKCGLVALSIATTIKEVPISVEKIFDRALSLGYTKQGEIFSAESLADLAEKCCGFVTDQISGGLYFHFQCIIKRLLNKNLILLPYDADHNHYPCCKNGFKAHWAVISGIAIFAENESPEKDEHCDAIILESEAFPVKFCDCSIDDNPRTNLLNIYSQERKVILSKNPIDNSKDFKGKVKGQIYLIGRQGKSKHIGLWPFHETSMSNNNLMFFSPKKDINRYLLPEGGLEKGLKGKAIVLKI